MTWFYEATAIICVCEHCLKMRVIVNAMKKKVFEKADESIES
jgi:hypothetical protein